MKPAPLCFLFCLLCFIARTQQKPQYTQYIFNNYLLNPAISGIEDYTDVRLGHRSQWQGFEGSPVTNYISIHTPIGKGYIRNSVNSFSGQGSNPMSRSYVQNYAAAEPHHGIGLHVVADQAGPLKYLDANATYAYHLGLSPSLNIAVGVAAGIANIHLDIEKVKLDEDFDPAIAYSSSNVINPDLGAGVWLYGPRFFLGLSGQQLLSRKLVFRESGNRYKTGTSNPHYFATAGYKFFLSEDISAVPSVMLRKTTPVPASFDLNLKLTLRDQFWVGGTYRRRDAYAALIGFSAGHLLNIGYSYDLTLSELKTVSNGSHEIILGLLLNNRYRVRCPQRNW